MSVFSAIERPLRRAVLAFLAPRWRRSTRCACLPGPVAAASRARHPGRCRPGRHQWGCSYGQIPTPPASGPSKSARDERQSLLGRPPTSPPSPNRPPSIPTDSFRRRSGGCRAHSGSKGGRCAPCAACEAAPRSVRRGSACKSSRLELVSYMPLANNQRGAVRILATKAARPDQLHTAGTRTGPHLAPRAAGAATGTRHKHHAPRSTDRRRRR